MMSQVRASFRPRFSGRIGSSGTYMLRLADLALRRQSRQLRSGRVRSALALGRIPIFGRKCDSPEQWRGLAKFNSDFHFAGVFLANERNGAGELFGCLGIDDCDLLGARHAIRHFDHAAIGVHRDCVRLFLEILGTGLSTDNNWHCDLNALSATSFRSGFAGARYGVFDLSHQSSPELGEANVANAQLTRRVRPTRLKFYTARSHLPPGISSAGVPIVNTVRHRPLTSERPQSPSPFAKSPNPL